MNSHPHLAEEVERVFWEADEDPSAGQTSDTCTSRHEPFAARFLKAAVKTLSRTGRAAFWNVMSWKIVSLSFSVNKNKAVSGNKGDCQQSGSLRRPLPCGFRVSQPRESIPQNKQRKRERERERKTNADTDP